MIGTPKIIKPYYLAYDNKVFKVIPIGENVFPIFNFREFLFHKDNFKHKDFSMILSYKGNDNNKYILGIVGTLEVMGFIRGSNIANDLESIPAINYNNENLTREEIIDLLHRERNNYEVIKIVITNKRETSEIFICIATPQALIDRGYNVEILTN